MLYLVNPKRKGGRMAARRKKRATPAQLRALAKARRAKKAKTASRKRVGRKAAATRKRKSTTRRKTTTRRKPVARKRTTRRTTKRRLPRRRSGARRGRSLTFRPVRGKVYTKNPRFTMRGIGRTLQQGAIDASGVVVGKAATRMVSNMIPFGGTGAIALLKQALSAVAVGMVASRFINPSYARFVLAGGLAAPVETFLQGLPIIGPAISGGEQLGEYLGIAPLPIGEYIQEGSQYPQDVADVAMGEYVEYYS